MNIKLQLVMALPTAATLGLVSICLPVVILQPPRHPSPLFPLIFTGIEELSWLTILFLFISGVILSVVFVAKSLHALHPLLLGLMTMAAFPVLAIAEMVKSSFSHNLWPIEFVFYGILSGFAIGGTYTGYALRRKISSLRAKTMR